VFKRAKVIAALAGASTALVLAFAGSASAAAAPSAPSLKLHTVTLKDGAISVSVTYSCSAGSVDEIWVVARQVVDLGDGDVDDIYGARTLTTADRPNLTCDGKSHRLKVGLVANHGEFGKTLTDVEGELWTANPDTAATAAKSVQL
jgi:hypothetical protein